MSGRRAVGRFGLGADARSAPPLTYSNATSNIAPIASRLTMVSVPNQARSETRIGISFPISPSQYLKKMLNKQTIKAKNVTPSISAAAMIMAVWTLLATSGCRAMLSTAEEPLCADALALANDH